MKTLIKNQNKINFPTPCLDKKIDALEYLKSDGSISAYGQMSLDEYKKIRDKKSNSETPCFDDLINNLEVSKSNGTISAYGEISLDEYKKIKAQLN
jgi:hypothetical protein